MIEYKDFKLTDLRNPLSNDINIIKGSNCIGASLNNLINTKRTEIAFNREKGIGLKFNLFEVNDEQTVQNISSFFKDTVNLFEPRIKSLEIDYTITKNNLSLNAQYDLVDFIGKTETTKLKIGN